MNNTNPPSDKSNVLVTGKDSYSLLGQEDVDV